MGLLKADAQKVTLSLLKAFLFSSLMNGIAFPGLALCKGYKKSCDCVALQSMAVKIVETILKVSTEISEPAQVETLLDFVKPLIANIPGVEVDEEVCLHMQPIRCAQSMRDITPFPMIV